MTDAAAPPAPAPEGSTNPLIRIGGVVISPAETMRSIAARPNFIVALGIFLFLAVVTSVVVAPHIDLRASLQPMLEKQHMKPEVQEKAIEVAEKIKQFAAPIGAISQVVFILLIAGCLFGVVKAFGAAGSFHQFISVTVYSWFPQILQGLLATVLVLRKGSITTEEMITTVKSNPAFLTSQLDAPALFALFTTLDLFNLWTVILLTLGVSYSSRLSRGRSAAVVVSLWVLSILIRTGLAAMQGGPH